LRITKKIPQRDKINRYLKDRQGDWIGIARPDEQEKWATRQVVYRRIRSGEIENFRPLNQPREMRVIIRSDVAPAQHGADRQQKSEGKRNSPQNARPTRIHG